MSRDKFLSSVQIVWVSTTLIVLLDSLFTNHHLGYYLTVSHISFLVAFGYLEYKLVRRALKE